MVEVRAPLWVPKQDIDRFVAEKEQWILENVEKQHNHAAKKESFKVDYGSVVTLRDKEYPIVKREGKDFCMAQAMQKSKHAGFDEEVLYMPPGLTPEQIKATCIKLYRSCANVHITSRVSAFGARMNLAPSVVKISNATRRWGSCSSKKSLNFSWRLIMADDDVIDYVVVHELAHLVEMNHSKRFWAVVAAVLPDYKARQARLKHLYKKLSNEDWG